NLRRPANLAALQQADVQGVRPYRAGDSPRDIHWRTTARRNTLMVREYDSTQPLELILLVEPYLPANPMTRDLEQFEAALSLAATLFWAWCHSDHQPEVTLAVAGADGGAIRAGRANDRFARHALSLLGAASGAAQPTFPLSQLRSSNNRCARVVVSSRRAEPLAQKLRQELGMPFVYADALSQYAWYTPPSGDGPT
ncbi:MAG: DUF58 domain-containing protein, partial [Gemmataceae bacterium]